MTQPKFPGVDQKELDQRLSEVFREISASVEGIKTGISGRAFPTLQQAINSYQNLSLEDQSVLENVQFSVYNDGSKNGYYVFGATFSNNVRFIRKITDDELNALKDKIKEDSETSFEIIDNQGNIVAKIDRNGIKSIDGDFQKLISQLFESSDELFEIADLNGNTAFKIDKDGLTLTDIISNIGELKICDGSGNVIFEITSEGVDFFGKNEGGETPTQTVVQKEGNTLADIMQIIVNGQSLSVSGTTANAYNFYDALTFSGGILTNYDPDDITARDNYYNSDFIDLPTSGRETPGKGFVRSFKDAVELINGIKVEDQDFKLLVNAPGEGGLPLYRLADKTDIYYRRLIESVQYASDFAMNNGKSHNVPFIMHWQGETDLFRTKQDYYNQAVAYFSDLNNDIKAITGQTNDVHFIVYQVATHENSLNPDANPGVSQAFLQLSLDLDNVTLAPVMYAYDYTDAFHMPVERTRQGGAVAGVAAVRSVFNRDKQQPMYPNSHVITSNSQGNAWSINLEITPNVAPLVVDTTQVSQATNYGFSILNTSESEIITGVSVRRNGITIITKEDPTGKLLTYCIRGVGEPGNIRDSQGDQFKIAESVNEYRLDNWLPMFEYQL